MEQRRLISGSRKLVGVAAGFSLLLGFTLVAQGFIDTKDYREQVVSAVAKHTGREVVLKGRITASLLPRPRLFIPGIEIRSADDKDTAPTFTAKSLYLNADIFSLFSDELRISSIAMESPVLELRRVPQGTINWGWLGGSFLNGITGVAAEKGDISLSMNEGRILFINEESNRTVALRQFSMQGTLASRPEFSGAFELDGRQVRYGLRTQGEAASANSLPVQLRLASGAADEFSLDGQLDREADMLVVEGKASLKVADVMVWVKPASNREENEAGEPPVPLAMESGWKQRGWQVEMPSLAFDGLSSKGSGSASFVWDDMPHVTAEMRFGDMDYGPWRVLANLLAERLGINDDKTFSESTSERQPALPQKIKIDANISAEQLLVNGRPWQKATLAAQLADGAITINQFSVNMPDEANITLFGLVSQGTGRSLRFEGSVESQGKSLRNLLTMFDETAGELPETGFGEFSIRSNMFVSPEQLRLSEAEVKFSELQLSGGLVAYFDSVPRIEADVKLRDINFDYFRNVWRDSRQASDSKDFFLRFNKNLNFNWLRSLRTNIDFKVIVDRFTFMERQGDSAAFRLFAQQGEFGIYNLRFYYPDNTVEVSLNLNVKNEVPFFTVIFNSDSDVDTQYFRASEEGAAPETAATTVAPAGNWSKELFDMSWMEGYNASLDVSVRRLLHRGTALDRFKLKADIRNQTLNLQTLDFGFWQGSCRFTGTLNGGKVPALNTSLLLSNVDLKDLINTFSPRSNITGRMGISGSVTTSGVNLESWVSQAEGKFSLNGVGVDVANFNLQGVTDTVGVARTTADVVNNVNLLLPRGSTRFSSVEGNVNLSAGALRTPGLTLTSGNVQGGLEGEIKLLPWTLNLSSMFQFPTLTSETIPTMTIKLSGSVDEADMLVDTDSLEAYVSKRIVGQ
jgi:uncharacterized protein involved in outer membrane biogenesis